ncbi:hypothetical protein JT150_03525 [Helicobacter pylori]|nr:hypothetical protein [Helicobacter pylori]
MSSKTALANDNDPMAGIFDEFNELKANKETQKNLTRSIMGMATLIKSLMFLTIRMVILSVADCLSLRN